MLLPVSKAQQRAVAKYSKENYDTLLIRIPKGRKAVIQACADKAGQSLNAYVTEAVEGRIKRENGQIIPDGEKSHDNT